MTENEIKEEIRRLEEELVRLTEKEYPIGQWFKIYSGYYILAQVNVGQYCLIGLWDGNRWKDPVSSRKLDDLVGKARMEDFVPVDCPL